MALAFLPNPKAKKYVDHINRKKTNNNISNLRWATNSENMMNIPKKSSNTSGYIGVYYDKSRNKYCAEITINYKKKHLGRYNTALEASEAYQAKAKEMFGEFYNS